MSEVKIYKKPATNVFSRNPIPFAFRIVPFNAASLIDRLKVSVLVQFAYDMQTPTYQTIWQGAISPNAEGLCNIDVSAILDPKLEFYVPNLNLKKIQKAEKQCGKFRITYFVSKNETIVSHQYTTEAFNIYKGGVGKEYHDKDSTYLNDELILAQKPLHYHLPNEPIRWNEVKWCFAIYKDDTQPYALQVDAEFNLEDASGYDYLELFVQNVSLIKGQIYCVRMDLLFSNYLNEFIVALDPYDAIDTKILIQTAWGSGVIALPTPKLTIDSRPFEHEQFILYRNSLGGLESQSLLGESEMGTSIQSANTELVPLADEIGNYVVENTIQMEYSTHNPVTKANTGWLTKATLQRLIDLLMNKEVYQVKGKRIVPIQINTGSLALYKSNDKLFNLAFDYSAANDDENFSQENIVDYANACPAIEYFEASQKLSGYITIAWKLPFSLTQMELVLNGTSIGSPSISQTLIVNGNSGTKNILVLDTAQNPIVNYVFTVTARVVCDSEVGAGSYGPATTITGLVISSVIPPIAVDDEAQQSTRDTNARILQFNNATLNPLSNDIPTTLPEVEFHQFCNSFGASSTQSANGANLTWLAPGIQYTPTGGSIAILAEDIIYYKCKESLPSTGANISNLASIKVPLTGQIYKVYCKMSLLDIETGFVMVGPVGPGAFKTGILSTANVWIQFFQDAACTVPLNVDTYGIVIGYKLDREESALIEDIVPPNTPTTVPNVTAGTIATSGTSVLAFPNYEFVKPDNITMLQYAFHFKIDTATSVGNFEIVGPTF